MQSLEGRLEAQAALICTSPEADADCGIFRGGGATSDCILVRSGS